MEDFTKRKLRVLRGLVSEGARDNHEGNDNEGESSSAGTSKPDKSLKGNVDTLLIPICEFLNSHPDYVTTSCCSGRITAYQQAYTAEGKRVKSGGRLVYVSHDPVNPSEAEKLLTEILEGACHYPERKSSKQREAAVSTLRHTDLKLEPLILHVEAATAAAALALLRAAVSAGLRESGISALGKRNLVAIRGSQRMETPLTLGAPSYRASLPGEGVPLNEEETRNAATREEEAVLVTPAYFSSLLFLCKEKLECNARQINRLYETLKKQLDPSSSSQSGTTEGQGAASHAHPQMAGDAHCGVPSESRESAARPESAAACISGNESGVHGRHSEAPTDTARMVDQYVGVKDKKQLKAVKSALEALGLFDKTRKMHQISIEGTDSAASGVTPSPPPDCPWLKLLPVRGAVRAASLPRSVQDSLVFDAEAEGSLQLFSFSSPPSTRVIKKSVGGCLDALLRAACESTAHGSILMQRAKALRCGEPSEETPAVPATAETSADPAADEPLISWPEKFERMGDVILLPSGSLAEWNRLKHMGWHIVGATQMALIETSVWRGFCKEYGAKAVGVQAPISGPMRQSRAHLLFGSSGLTTVRENGVLYSFDVTKCMFASGNGTERLRFRENLLASKGPPETVVDMFCGIGYFSLGALAFVPPERLERLYACDINPRALQFFHSSLAKNRVDPSRVTFLLCDSFAPPSGAVVSDAAAVAAAVADSDAAEAARAAIFHRGNLGYHHLEYTTPTTSIPAALLGVADRISLGLIPSSEEAWPNAVALLNDTRGGTLHIHGVAPLEAVNEEEKAVSSSVSVHPENCSGDPTANGCGGRKRVGGNCKLGARLQFAQHALQEIATLIKGKATKGEQTWEVHIRHVEKVKSYAPKLYHFVVDITAHPAF